MTRAMREVREESEMYKYDKVGTLIKLTLKNALYFKQEVVLEKEWYLLHFTPFGITACCVAKRPSNWTCFNISRN